MAETPEATQKEIRLLIDFWEAKLLCDGFLLDVSTKVLITNTVKHLKSLKVKQGERDG